MANEEKDRIQNAIRHIKTSVDVDEWAMEIAVDAMEKQVPKKPRIKLDDYDDHYETLYRMYCRNCSGYLGNRNKRVGYIIRRFEGQMYCGVCGQQIDWPEEWL